MSGVDAWEGQPGADRPGSVRLRQPQLRADDPAQRPQADGAVAEDRVVEGRARRSASPSAASASARSREDLAAGRSCRRAPGRARRCSGRPRSRCCSRASAVFSTMKSIGLLARPAQRVHAGVDDEPAGAPRVEREHRRCGRGRPRRGPSRRPGARCRAPQPSTVRGRAECACGTRAGPSSSCAIAIWRWWPGHGLVKGQRLGLVARPRRRARSVLMKNWPGRDPSGAGWR